MTTKRWIENKAKDHKSIAQDFRSFLLLLEEEEELVRVSKSVSSKFELAAVVSKLEGKQAILFEKIDKSQFKVASNVIGTRTRFALAVAMTEYDLIHSHFLRMNGITSEPKRMSGSAPFYENSSKDLNELPIVSHFEKDAGPYITSSIVF